MKDSLGESERRKRETSHEEGDGVLHQQVAGREEEGDAVRQERVRWDVVRMRKLRRRMEGEAAKETAGERREVARSREAEGAVCEAGV